MRWLLIAIAVTGCAAQTDKLAWPFLLATHLGEAAPLHARPGARAAMGGDASDAYDDQADEPSAAHLGTPTANARAPEPSAEQPVFYWPLSTTGINSLYGERIDPIDGRRRFHGGIDIEGHYGALVSAAAPGVVVHADWAHGHGRQVIIEHAAGFRTVYSHLAQVLVLPGTVVHTGDVIGQVGNSGRSTGAHLHFEVMRWNSLLDPLDVLAEQP